MPYKDRAALDQAMEMPCEVCGWWDEANCAHHIKTRGSGGGDEWFNIVPVCHKCHTSIHQYGYNKFIEKKPRMLLVMKKRGWFKDEFDKWKCMHQMEGCDTSGPAEG